MKNATYWIEQPGQIEPDEVVEDGYRDARSAWAAQKALGHGRVACLKTIEHELPVEDPAHVPFESSRWCLIVPRERKAG